MEIHKGIGVSPGVAISRAVVVDAEDIRVPKRPIKPKAVDAERERLRVAYESAREDLSGLRDQMKSEHGPNIGSIFDFHMGMLKDKSFTGEIDRHVERELVTAEGAVSAVMRGMADKFLAMSDAYFADRVKDIYDIARRLIRKLLGNRADDLNKIDGDVIVVAHDLLPSQTAALDREHVRGFATDVGGRTSHTAIVARAMNIPAVVGCGRLTRAVAGGSSVIVDGTRGLVIVDPDAARIAEYEVARDKQVAVDAELAGIRDLPAITQDGHAVELQGNIEFPTEIEDSLMHGAAGIGLYRTEFLYLAAGEEPSEDEHYEAYADAIRRLAGKPMVIRTLDLGADKYSHAQAASPEKNPFLGNRSIRMCLHDIPMFKTQLRAVLRASVLGPVKLMFPMISTLMELRQAKMILFDVMDELEDEGVEFDRGIDIGMMVEVPAAAFMAQQFAKEVKFFSIGTNDLIQYTLAVDRTNEKVAGLFNPAHPAVLALIRDVIRAGQRAKIGVSVCGEMAGEPLYTLLLLGLGLTTFSMNGPDVPEVKKIIRSTTLEHAKGVSRKVMSFDSERQVMHYLREETRKIVPDLL